MFPIPMFGLYVVAAYILWWCISRSALVAAWLYAKPGTFTIRHYILCFIGLCPLAFEIISSVLIIFATAFGFNLRERD